MSEKAVDIGRTVREMKDRGLLPPLDEFQRIVSATNTDDPDKADVAELRRMLKEYPAMWRTGGDLARHAVTRLVDEASGGAAFVRESMEQGVEAIRANLGYDHAPEIERLLIEQVGLCWLRLNVMEYRYTQIRGSGTMGIHQAEWLEKRLNYAQRRFLRAIETLARVRKVTRQTLALQVNIAADGGQQVNVLGDVKQEAKG